MRATSGAVIPPLDWPALVDEALRRRRAERLTQKEHAALAGVSVPTVIAFDRKETTLSLAKAFAILDIVGLVAARTDADPQDAFATAAERRWQELTGGLPADSPIRMPHGHYAVDYAIAGASAGSARALLDALRRADRGHTGWPPFWVPTRGAIAPYPVEDGIECWLGRDTERDDRDAAHNDFWCATRDARLYLRRGYREDSTDVLPPAAVFDLTLPVWRAGEALLHAHHLAEALGAPAGAEVRLRVRCAGLAGRELKSWANPYRDVPGIHRCRTGEASHAVSCPAGAIADRLPELVHALLAPVYERFDFYALPPELVTEELARLRSVPRR
ncbi:hypothetical protein [Azospirillum halopraeferens]|uniref:hypothetical protein n=1 Tax=Azospirillum halopraeferens TaxID=34010 RepID=UPI0006877511|nr:hypothetical protein [Azospirillum halopraeferens]